MSSFEFYPREAEWPDARIKSCPIFPKSYPKSRHSSLTYKVTFFKIAQKVATYFGYFCKKNCKTNLSKIAQSGHIVVKM